MGGVVWVQWHWGRRWLRVGSLTVYGGGGNVGRYWSQVDGDEGNIY